MGAREVFVSWVGWLIVSASRATSWRVRANSKMRSISLCTSAEKQMNKYKKTKHAGHQKQTHTVVLVVSYTILSCDFRLVQHHACEFSLSQSQAHGSDWTRSIYAQLNGAVQHPHSVAASQRLHSPDALLSRVWRDGRHLRMRCLWHSSNNLQSRCKFSSRKIKINAKKQTN